MRLRLDHLFVHPGECRSLDEEFSPDWQELSPFSLAEPVRILGRVENKAGVVTASFLLSSTMTAVCDRCLDPVSIPVSLQAEHVLVRSLSTEEDEDRFWVVPDAVLDTQELARTDLILNLPTRVLCREDCRGLCPVCGANRNQTDCGCSSGK